MSVYEPTLVPVEFTVRIFWPEPARSLNVAATVCVWPSYSKLRAVPQFASVSVTAYLPIVAEVVRFATLAAHWKFAVSASCAVSV